MSSYAQHFAHLKAIFSKVMALHQIDYVAIYSGASQGQFMDDMYYPFVSNPFFNYW